MNPATLIAALLLATTATAQKVKGRIYAPPTEVHVAASHGAEVILRPDGRYRIKCREGVDLTIAVRAEGTSTKTITIPAHIMAQRTVRMDIVVGDVCHDVVATLRADQYGLLHIDEYDPRKLQ